MGFPKTYKRGDLTRTVNTPADEVDAKFNGFKELHDVDIQPESDSFVVDPVVETPGPSDEGTNEVDADASHEAQRLDAPSDDVEGDTQ